MNTQRTSVVVATAPHPGAIGLIQLLGPDAPRWLQTLTGRNDFLPGVLRLVNFADLDQGLAVLLREDWAQLMPHGGLRVMRRIVQRLVELGAADDRDVPARLLYPEARSELEADMLATVARAASPAAIDLLLAQPTLWRIVEPHHAEATLQRTKTLDRLLDPPMVVVVGAPNVGKSTLTNRMLGRSASLVADLPGTTRDWVAGLAGLSGVAVRWLDTPGIRDSDDAIEQQALALARQVIAQAHVLIAMRDPRTEFPTDLPRQPDVWVVNKTDEADGQELAIRALDGVGLEVLQRRVLDVLGLADLSPAPWAFSPTLKALLARNDTAGLREYHSPSTWAMR